MKNQCEDCSQIFTSKGKRKRCEACSKKREIELQRLRRGTPDSFICKRCNKNFPIPVGGKAALKKWCEECQPVVRREQSKKYYRTNPEKRKKTTRDSYRKNIEKNRQLKRKHQAKRRANPQTHQHDLRRRRAVRYGITIEEIIAVEELIGKPCPICSAILSKKGKYQTCIDHDHETGQVRGVLCSECNTALGMFGDNPDNLRSAAAYLAKHRSK